MSATHSEPHSSHGNIAARLIGAAGAAWRTLAASLNPGESDGWLLEAQLRLYRSSTRYSTILIVVGGFVVALVFAPWVSLERRFGWFALLTVVGVGLEIMARHLDGVGLRTRAHVRRRAWLHLFDSGLLVFCWCLMAVALWAPGNVVNHMLLLSILCCSLAGSVSTISIHPASGAAVFGLHAFFIIVPAALAADNTDHMFAALAAVFVIIMATQIVATHMHLTKLLRLEHERGGIVDDLHRAKAESDRERMRATSASRAKSQFLSHMNHELRTPMNAILGFSEMIKSKAFGANIDKYSEYAGIIHESGEHLLGLINDMIDLSKIEGGKLYLREAEFSLADLAAEEFARNEAKAEDGKLSFIKLIEPGIPPIRADERGIRQIVANLVSNAIKYTAPGGCVTLFARSEPDGRIAFGVEDTGIGIAPEDQLGIFERFGRGRHDVTTADRGTGLGLAIVKGFTDAHDGEVALESELGAGTRVTVTLPKDRVMPRYAMKAAG